MKQIGQNINESACCSLFRKWWQLKSAFPVQYFSTMNFWHFRPSNCCERLLGSGWSVVFLLTLGRQEWGHTSKPFSRAFFPHDWRIFCSFILALTKGFLSQASGFIFNLYFSVCVLDFILPRNSAIMLTLVADWRGWELKILKSTASCTCMLPSSFLLLCLCSFYPREGEPGNDSFSTVFGFSSAVSPSLLACLLFQCDQRLQCVRISALYSSGLLSSLGPILVSVLSLKPLLAAVPGLSLPVSFIPSPLPQLSPEDLSWLPVPATSQHCLKHIFLSALETFVGHLFCLFVL